MDSVNSIKLRLSELIDGMIERKGALLKEVEAIDNELAEAKCAFARLQGVVPVAPVVPAESQFVPVVSLTKLKKEKRVIKMRREEALEFIRTKGPCHWKEIINHFGLTDGRSALVLRMWAKQNFIVSLGDGFYTVPGPVEVSKTA